ncbi:MAG: thioredoxin family protein [Dethiobacteria bacterium]|nr:thioredoxin family protein [Dethiobacteria bacterium]
MEIKVLGTGCPKCNTLEKMVQDALQELNAEATIEKVTNINDIAMAGVMLTPALIIDGDVKVSGTLPSQQNLVKMIVDGLNKN